MSPATTPAARAHFTDQLTAELRETAAPALLGYWRELKAQGAPDGLATALTCHLQGVLVDDLFPGGLAPGPNP